MTIYWLKTHSINVAPWPCVIAFFVFLVPMASFSQSQGQSDPNLTGEQDSSVTCVQKFTFELVLVEVEVKDENGAYVSGLRHDEFLIYDNRKRQEILICKEEEEADVDGSPIKYRIGYLPPYGMDDGEYRRIRVKIRNGKDRGLKIQYSPKDYIAVFNKAT